VPLFAAAVAGFGRAVDRVAGVFFDPDFFFVAIVASLIFAGSEVGSTLSLPSVERAQGTAVAAKPLSGPVG
jgi:hypothetical protein